MMWHESAFSLQRIEEGQLDPSFVITHQRSLDDAPDVYDMFREKRDGCIKAALHP